MTSDERLAAELAIGLLAGEDLVSARARVMSDPAFAQAVDDWAQRLAPLLDAIPPQSPPEYVWDRIEAALSEPARDAEVVQLRRRLRFWQRAAGGAAIAACAAFAAVVLRPQVGEMPGMSTSVAAPLVASIPIGDTPLRLGVTYLPDRGELLVSASGLSADGVHDHELWLVPDAGAPLSLGVVAPGYERRVPLDPAIAARIHDGSEMVLTREPLGGKPPAATTAGPVVAQGRFVRT